MREREIVRECIYINHEKMVNRGRKEADVTSDCLSHAVPTSHRQSAAWEGKETHWGEQRDGARTPRISREQSTWKRRKKEAKWQGRGGKSMTHAHLAWDYACKSLHLASYIFGEKAHNRFARFSEKALAVIHRDGSINAPGSDNCPVAWEKGGNTKLQSSPKRRWSDDRTNPNPVMRALPIWGA